MQCVSRGHLEGDLRDFSSYAWRADASIPQPMLLQGDRLVFVHTVYMVYSVESIPFLCRK
jgi:hypothetical protein